MDRFSHALDTFYIKISILIFEEVVYMTPEVEKIDKQKKQLFMDVYDNKIPERVPINVALSTSVVAGYAGIHGGEALWNPSLLTKASLELADAVPTDVSIFAGSILAPESYQALGANNMKISSAGLMQHPNHVGLFPEDYDAFIKNAYDCIIEVVVPRNYANLDFRKDPVRAMFAVAQGIDAKAKHMAKDKVVSDAVKEKHGGWASPLGSRIGCYAPLDIFTDNLRSLSGISADIRRFPDKVEAAVESLYALNYRVGIPPKPSNYGQVFFPLHLATYMRENDFERLWWKPFLRQVTDYASLGIHSYAFCEHDWMRLLDYVQELPTNTMLQFEKCDPKLIKEKLGKKFILTGGFPLETLRLSTKQECIDKTKEFLDIMMPGGKFIFMFDKSALTFEDVNLENLKAVCETVRDYGVYKNAGEKAGLDFNQSDYTHSEVPPVESKYYRTWEQYKELNPLTPESAKKEVMDQEDMILKFVYSLCQ
jgi:hypothetical protein